MDLKNLIPFGKKDADGKREQRVGHPLTVMQREVNRLLESFFSDLDGDPFLERTIGFSPKINVGESEKDLVVTAELPGIDEKDVEVSLTTDSLTIRGEKKVEQTGGFFRSERAYGSFSRTIPLPGEIDHEKVEAGIRQGVLTVRLPKTARTIEETKKVYVRTE